MGKFNRDSRPGGGKPFGKGGFGGPRQMHKAVCSKCGNECEVPFVPTGDRPVLCNNCFKNQGDGGGRPGRDFNRPGSGNRQMHQAICAKCGNKCEVPFLPTAGKPVYCEQCFGKGGNAAGKGGGGITREQLDILNSKLDRILKALGPAVSSSVESEKKAPAGTIKSEAALGKKVAKAVPAKKKTVAKKPAKKKK